MVLGTDPGRGPLDSKKEIYNKPHRRQGNYIPSHFPISSLHHEKFISPTIRLKFTTEGRPGKGGSCVAANHHAIPWRGDSSTKSLTISCFHTGMMLLYTWLGRLPYGRVRTLWGQCPGAGHGVHCAGLSQLTAAQPWNPHVWYQSASDIGGSHENNMTSRHVHLPLSSP